MKIINFEGCEYRLFIVDSIHERARHIECRNVSTGTLVCEIGYEGGGLGVLLPTKVEISLTLLMKVIDFAMNG